jgi:hypothetical protein
MASGHVNRANRPNTWPQPTNCTVKKTLANGAPSTHGTSPTCHLWRAKGAYGSKADSGKPPQGAFMRSRPSLLHSQQQKFVLL